MTLLERRRAMMGGGGGGSLADYVQNGLIFHLDGKSRGGVAGHWTDLIGNVDFTLDAGVIEESNGIVCTTSQFARDSTYGNNESSNSDYTIECVFREDNNFSSYIGLFAPVSGIGFGVTTGSNPRFYFGWRDSSSSTSQWRGYRRVSTTAINTVSINNSRGVRNGTDLTGTGTLYSSKGSSCYAGAIIGKLFSVRIYSRLLSRAEMIDNQKVDDKRFNLGLNIT